MDSDGVIAYPSMLKCCDCGCNCCSPISMRSVKRKFTESENGDNKFVIPGLNLPQNARVHVENECMVLREMVSKQQNTILDLTVELEEERNAASSAANEAMSMILRLQREKAEIEMEARQFKTFAEEKMEHDLEEFLGLEDLLYKREEELESISCEVEMYKHRMMSFGLSEAEATGEIDRDSLISRNQSMSDNYNNKLDPQYELYPSLRINLIENQVFSEHENEWLDVEETPHSLKDLECRINELEKSPRIIHPEGEYNTKTKKKALEKVSPSPRRTRHYRKFSSSDRFNSFATPTQSSPRLGTSFKKTIIYSQTDRDVSVSVSDIGDPTSDDRVYTIDSVVNPGTTPRYGVTQHNNNKAYIGLCYDDDDDYVPTPKAADPDVQKLYARLQALEADRESMRQSIISMQTDKAQLLLLNKIAQQFFKEKPSPQKPTLIKPSSSSTTFSFLSLCKCIASIVLWRRKSQQQCKYLFGFSTKNAGLLSLLDKGQQQIGQGKYHMYREHKLNTTSFLN